MKLLAAVKGDSLIVRVQGELDLLVAGDFARNLDRILAQKGVVNLVLNLEGVTFIDSSGLGVILGRYKRLQSKGGRVSVIGAQPQVSRILDLSGISRLIPLYHSENEAFRAAGGA